MKNRLRFMALAAVAVIMMLKTGDTDISAQPSNAELLQRMADQRKNFEEFRQKQRNMLEAMKANNNKFRIGLTEANKYRLEQITGLKKPDNLEDEMKKHEKEEKKKLDEEKKKKDEFKEENKDKKLPEDNNPCNPTAKAFNWRDAKKVTPIKMQFSCGSCWAFAATASYESNYLIRNNKSIDLSEQHVIGCSGAGSCNGGWYEGVFRMWEKRSGVDEATEPYENKNSSCRVHAQTPYFSTAWGYVRSTNPAKKIPGEKEIKEALCQYGALASTVKVTDFFQSYKGGIYDEHAKVSGENDINHAINIVGWDDSKKAWLIKNSWSTNWGEQGYMWIEYGSNNIGFGTMWVMAKSEILDK